MVLFDISIQYLIPRCFVWLYIIVFATKGENSQEKSIYGANVVVCGRK